MVVEGPAAARREQNCTKHPQQWSGQITTAIPSQRASTKIRLKPCLGCLGTKLTNYLAKKW